MVMLVGVDDVTSKSVGASETEEERGALKHYYKSIKKIIMIKIQLRTVIRGEKEW